MITLSAPLKRLAALARLLGPAFAMAICLLLGLAAFGAVKEVHLADLTRDPTAVLKGPVYAGALSNLGILLWASAATVCFFASSDRGDGRASRGRRRFLLESGLVTSILLLDDLFLLHETVAPRYLGISEKVVYIGYGLLIAQHLARFAGEIASTDWEILFISFGWFALSIFMDIVPVHSATRFFLEDGAKFLGIVSWLVYFWRVGKLSARVPR